MIIVVPAVVARLVKLGARLHMQCGAGEAVALPDEAYRDVAFTANRRQLLRDADVVLAIQPPALAAIGEMRPARSSSRSLTSTTSRLSLSAYS
jgi:NAD(P) transhydrogenase subunit alpha